ncbi:MAG: formylglycine-generating enzyme family protein [Pirellulaceae bacterium]|nr:formylglycine-generating enzyme family protein [Pirellulaceae bacterium]
MQTQQGWMVPFDVTIPGSDIKITMLPVPASSIDVRQSDWIKPFWISKYEITLAQYREFMNLDRGFRELKRRDPIAQRRLAENIVDAVTAPTACYVPDERFQYAEDQRFDGGRKAPAASMTRFAARQYTKWLTLITDDVQYRLPTEREWEHACSDGRPGRWSFGDDPSDAQDYCVFDQGSRTGPEPVGSRAPNRWGIHDMHGNVAEWVLQAKTLRDHRQLSKPANDSVRFQMLREMVLKGGDWTKPIDHCRTSIREYATGRLWQYDPQFPSSPHWLSGDDTSRIGFRIVSPLIPHSRDKLEQFWGPDSGLLRDDIESQIDLGNAVIGWVDPTLPSRINNVTSK